MRMKRAFIVVNPAAGGGRTRRMWSRLRETLTRLDVEICEMETTGMGTGTELTRLALREGWPLVVAVGGDGTANEVVNGVMDSSGLAKAVVGIIPTGRGRDICRNLGIALDPDMAARRAIEGDEVVVDVGWAESQHGDRRYFINAAGLGFDAAVAERARTGRAPGTVGYLLAVLGSLSSYGPSPVSVSLDDAPASAERVAAVVVANGAYYGGGMKIAPSASPTDGLLEVVVLGDFGRLELLRWLPTLYSGGHLASAKVRVGRARVVSVSSTTRLPAHLDGEPVPDAPVRLSVHPHALRLRR